MAYLYARALHGNETQPERFLSVSVSPSWLDMRDLLGHVNSLTSSFDASDSGLYPFLILAHEEYRTRRGSSPVYLTLLDEMNLAHVEHYFSGFLQALPSATRSIRCFDPRGVANNSPFAKWPQLTLPPSLRFVGTVNFDETTKPLSLRLLDRADLIRIEPGDLGRIRAKEVWQDNFPVDGPAISSASFQSWIEDRPLPKPLAQILDRMRPHLEVLGSPVTPRRFRAISRFVASAVRVTSEIEAFDLQVAQRILPQLRGLFGRTSRQRLGELKSLLTENSLQRSSVLLEEIGRSELGGDVNPFAE